MKKTKYLIETGIGLQDVDQLSNSTYFLNEANRYINGEISLDELDNIVSAYYVNKSSIGDRTEEADKILADADKKSKELETNTKAELKLAAGQALEALKSEVADMISSRMANNAATELTAEKDFMGRFVVSMAKNWAAEGGMTVSTPDAEALTAYIRDKAKKLLTEGLKIEKVAGRPAAFSISPADGSYRVDFGPEEFAAYFKEFLRPQLVEMLFEPRS